MAEKRIRFANPAMDDIASVIASASPLAAQYLEQAPVLALLCFGKFAGNITYGELDRFTAIVGTQPRLRDVLAGYGAPAQMRKLSEKWLRPSHRGAVLRLARIDPSSLSQSIPDDSQSVWLDGIDKWLRLMPTGKKAQERFSVAWIARQLREDLSRFEQVDILIDYIRRANQPLNDKWSWATAMQRVEQWHQSLRDEANLRLLAKFKAESATFDKVICKAPIPDAASVDGLNFIALRTLRQLREEGQVMHHCVASYAADVRKGTCAIVSVRRDGMNIATIEIRGGSIVQLKSHCNGRVDEKTTAACNLYALLNWKPEGAA